MRPEHELHHIEHGPEPGELPEGVGLVTFDVRCHGNAQQVFERSREALAAVVQQHEAGVWPDPEDWLRILPQWFVAACAPENDEANGQAWLQWWRSLPPDEQRRVESETAWSVSDWLHWLQTDNRVWYWWDAQVDSDDEMRVAVQVDSWPFPWAALRWLLKASGAEEVSSEEE